MDALGKPRFSSKFYAPIIASLIMAIALAYGLSLVGQGFAARAGNSVTVTGQARTSATADNAV